MMKTPTNELTASLRRFDRMSAHNRRLSPVAWTGLAIRITLAARRVGGWRAEKAMARAEEAHHNATRSRAVEQAVLVRVVEAL